MVSATRAVKAVKWKLGIARSMARCSIRPNNNCSSTQICAGETAEIGDPGFSVDIADLFTPERDFLLKYNGEKVMAGDLKNKVIVLYMAPLYEGSLRPIEDLDMIQSYNELLPLGGVEFVFVPIYYDRISYIESERVFNKIFSTLPLPALPFSDVDSCGDSLVKSFGERLYEPHLPYFVVIDHTGAAVKKEHVWPYPSIFKLFGAAELYPLSAQRIQALEDEFYSDACSNRLDSRERLINKWDQLLASPTRDFLLSSTRGQVHHTLRFFDALKRVTYIRSDIHFDNFVLQVPISSLGITYLYFCDNVPLPPRMTRIKKVYEEAQSRGYDFEIVQINFHYHFMNSTVPATQDMSKQLCEEDVGWLTLPFKDPSCKKLQRIFNCDSDDDYWQGDCLVIVDPRQADNVLYEFSGAEIMGQYGIEGYPFTRQSLYELETGRQKREGKLRLLFPPGEDHFMRPAGEGCADYSQLAGKRVIVLVGKECESCAFMSMLKSKYRQQLHNDDKFEVVFVSIEDDESRFNECIKGMPWLVHPFSKASGKQCRWKIFKDFGELGAAAFGMDGELIARRSHLVTRWSKTDAPFPFLGGPDLETLIRVEVDARCYLDKYIDEY